MNADDTDRTKSVLSVFIRGKKSPPILSQVVFCEAFAAFSIHGGGSFLWPVASKAMAQGFPPDTISTGSGANNGDAVATPPAVSRGDASIDHLIRTPQALPSFRKSTSWLA